MTAERVLWGRSLLPRNATPLMRALSEAFAEVAETAPRAETIPDVLSYERCPSLLLPWLAWEWSVDEWVPTWDDGTKRSAIGASWDIHSVKGTVYALERGIGVLGYGATVTEWFQYAGDPFTFRLHLRANFEQQFDNDVRRSLLRAALRTKNVRSYLDSIQVASTGATVPIIAGAIHRATISFSPSTEPITAIGGQTTTYVGAVVQQTISFRPTSS